jgi:hypothetical protein
LKKKQFFDVDSVDGRETYDLAFLENAMILPTFVRADAIIAKATANSICDFLLLGTEFLMADPLIQK